MKRIFCFFILTFVLVTSGCSAKNKTSLQEEFSVSAVVSYQGLTSEEFSIEAEIIRSSSGELDINVIAPKELKGLSYSYGEGFEMSCLDLVCVSEKDYLPDFSFAQIIYNVFEDFFAGEGRDKLDPEGICESRCKSGDYVIEVDEQGYIKNISLKEINFVAEFNNK